MTYRIWFYDKEGAMHILDVSANSREEAEWELKKSVASLSVHIKKVVCVMRDVITSRLSDQPKLA